MIWTSGICETFAVGIWMNLGCISELQQLQVKAFSIQYI